MSETDKPAETIDYCRRIFYPGGWSCELNDGHPGPCGVPRFGEWDVPKPSGEKISETDKKLPSISHFYYDHEAKVWRNDDDPDQTLTFEAPPAATVWIQPTLHDRVAMHALTGLLAAGHLDPFSGDIDGVVKDRRTCIGQAMRIADAYMAEKARREQTKEESDGRS